jgi:hypothetical protein
VQIPWVRSQQELSLAGVKTGFFSRLQPDPLTEFVTRCAPLLKLAAP